ncbi:Ig-like domain-containing protein [Pseudoduganella sp. GCM10020061]|uniref:Ig-like domain-containing protein n=1 Tax=Pseudoduganella sp. GCM10020061 TaxID=3317345 RepID=UPI0036300C69
MPHQNTAARREIAFVNGNLPDLNTLLAGLRAGVDIVVLDPARDGLAQIEAALAGGTGIDAVHLVGHGASGVLQVGSTLLTTAYLQANPEALAGIRAALADDGDILLYGCETGKDMAGADFLSTMAALSGADVAASTDLTGAGGDWELERQEGPVETQVVFEGGAYAHALALQVDHIHTYSANTWAFSSMARAADGTIYLAHLENSNTISLKKWNGTDWIEVSELTTATAGVTNFGDDLSLQIGTDGNPALLFKHYVGTGSSSMRGVKYGEFDLQAGSWTTNVVQQASHPSGWYNFDDPMLAIGQNGVLHAVYNYADASVHDYYIKYATSTDNGATWTSSTVLQTTIAGIDELHIPKIRVDAAGTVHLFYVREDNQNDYFGNLYYQTKAAGSTTWSAPLKLAQTPETYYEVATDGNGKFWLAHSTTNQDGVGTTIHVVSNESGSWQTDSSLTDSRANYVYGMQVAAGKLHMLVASVAPDWSDTNMVVWRKDGPAWTKGYSGEAIMPQLSAQGEENFGEAIFSVGADGHIMVVTEDTDLRNIDSTSGTSDEFGLLLNAAPVVRELDGEVTQFTPGATDLAADYAYIDVQVTGTDQVLVSDADSLNFIGGTLSILQTGGEENGHFELDYLSGEVGFGPDSGSLGGIPSAGQKVFVLDGAVWEEVGRVHATLDGQDGRDLVIEFTTANSGARAAEFLIKYMMYSAPTAGERTFSLTVSDGDGGTSAASSFGMTGVDIVPPVVTGVTSTTGNGPWNVGDTISIQVTFNEAVTVTGTPVLALETGAIDRNATYTSGSGTNTLTFTYTVLAGDRSTDLDVTSTTALTGGTIADLAGIAAIRTLAAPGTAGSLGASKQIVVDGIAPTDLAISNAAITTLAGTHATVGSLSTTDGTASDTFTYTLVAGAGSTDNAAFEISGSSLRAIDASALTEGVKSVRVRTTDAAGNSYEEALAITVTTPPTVSISTDATSVNKNGTAVITFTFSDAPTGFVAGDVTVTGGSIGPVTVDPADSKVYTATFTPAPNVQALSATISVDAGKFTDAGGLANVASTQNVAITGDTLSPTVAVTSAQALFKAGETATITFTFSEAPVGFTAGDVTVTGGAIGAVSATADSKVYTATFTPAANVESLAGMISVAGARFTDAIGNQNTASTVNVEFLGDTLRPAVSDVNVSIGGASGANGTFVAGDTVTVSWNDGDSGDRNGDTAAVTVDFTQFGGPAAVAATLSNGVWTASYDIAPGAIDATNRNVSVTVTDDVGNTTTLADTSNASVDSQAPVLSQGALSLSGATGPGGVYRIGDVVTATWDNTADGNADAASVIVDFSQFGGGGVAAVSSNGIWTASYTITDSGLAASGLNVGLAVWDDAGNRSNLAGTSNAQVDALRATVTGITSSGANGLRKAGDTVSIQVKFSEAVTVTGTPVLALETGATDRSASYASGSGTDTLTFTYTVQAGDQSPDLDVTGMSALTGGTIVDAAGNAVTRTLAAPGAAGSLGANKAIVIDGVAPTAIALDHAEVNTQDGAHAAVGVLSSTDIDPADTFTYSLVAGAGDTDNAAFEIVGNTLQAIDASELAAGVRSVRVRTTDAAGNTYEQVLEVTVTANPTVAISTSTSTVNASGTALITFTFSAAPSGFTAGDVTVTGGTLGEVTADPLNSKLYTATFTPAAGQQALQAAISVGAGVFTNAGGLGNLASTANVEITGDTLLPTVSIGSSRSVFKAGDTATVTFTFSEVPAGFTDGDITVTGGTLTGLAATSDSKVYTATFTPAADVASLAGAISIAGAVVTDAAGNPNAASTANVAISGDTLHPAVSDAHLSIAGATGANGAFRTGDTVTVAWNDGAGGDNNGDSVSATVDFSQFGGPAAAAATLANGVWSASYTITAGSIDSTMRNVSVTVTDDAGNVTTRSDSTNAVVDNAAPAVSDAALTIAGATGAGGVYRIGDVVTATWSNVTDGNTDIAGVSFDFSQFGGGVVAATMAGNAWSASYTVTETAISAGNRNVGVSVVDDAGNSTSRTDTANVQVDAVRAVVTGITSASPDGLRKIGDTVSIQVQFSEAVTVSGTPSLALETGVAGRSASYESGSGTSTLTFTYTVQAGDLSSDLDITGIAALAGAIVDAAGNAAVLALPAAGAAGSLGANEAIAIDGLAPAAVALSNATVTTLAGAHGAVGTLSTTDATPGDSFTYALVAGDGSTDNASFEVVGNALRAIDPASMAEGVKSVRVRTIDAAGNAHDEVLSVTVYAPPTVAISSDALSLKANGSTTITFTFSDTPVGFSASDVTVVGGTLGALTVSPFDSKVYTATFTPTPGVQNLNASVSIAAGTFSDQSTLLNLASTANAVITGDTLVPTVAIAIGQDSFSAGESATVSFTFSEAPLGFSLADVTVIGGTLDGLAPTADPRVYTATFTPSANSPSVAGAISVAGATFMDAAGNQNAASTINVVFSVDTLAPKISDAHLSVTGATGTNGAFRAGDTVTVSWNDGASGDDNGDTAGATVDFSQFGGPAAVAATKAGGVWSASFQIGAGAIDGINRNVSITVTDNAGNTATAADSSNASVDNQAPVVSDAALAVSGGANGVLRIGDTVTATWNDGAAGDNNGDIAGVSFDFSQFGGGTVAATRNGSTWSASYTVTELGTDVANRNVAVTVTDDAGNAAARTDTANLRIDAIRPLVSSITLAGTPAASATEIDFIVQFTEAVGGLDVSDFALALTGATVASINSVTGSGNSYTVRVSGIQGDGTIRLDLNGSGTGVADSAGNAIGAGFAEGAQHGARFNASPVFAGAATAEYSLAEKLTAVATLVAADADGDTVSYRISGGADAALFDIDAATGALRLKAAHRVAAPADSDADNRFQVEVTAEDGKGGTDVQAITVNLLADLDGDGLPDNFDADIDNDGRPNSAEDPVPGAFGGNGDGNGDGVADSLQLNVASIATVVAGAPYATLAVAEGYSLSSVSSSAAPAGLPRHVKMPVGQFDFTIGNVAPGGTVEMSIYVDASRNVNGYFKQDNNGVWTNLATSVTTVGAKTKITFSLTDGGIFDSDGLANGSIRDPGGVATIAPLIGSNGGGQTVRVSVAEMTRLVTTVSASSLTTASYAISGGADAALFEIDAVTGVLRFIGTPDYSAPLDAGADNTYSVQVTASDAFGSDTQDLLVAVTDVAVVDGVSVGTDTRTNDDGTTSQVVTVPVVQSDRQEQVGNTTAADIPLASSNGTDLLTALVPTGVGLQVIGSSAPQSVDKAMADLIREIRGVTQAGSHDQQQMTGGGSGFLSGLPTDANLLVKTVVPTVGSGVTPGNPIVIQGAAPGLGGPLSALVIDANNLPTGSEIQLNDVAFAAIVGNVRVTGGAGSQSVWGDGQDQEIMLGADDDILHGGAGNDTIGSAGGNDLIFGDEGDDLVFGGLGNDSIDGGSGLDVLRLVGGSRDDYIMRFSEGQLVLTHRDGGADGVDTVAGVESLRFMNGEADTTAYGTITRLYEALFDRAPDAEGISAWMAALGRGASLATVAQHMLAGSEFAQLELSNEEFVSALYIQSLGRTADAEGLAFWTRMLDEGKLTQAALALSVVDSAEKLAMPVVREIDFAATDAGTLVRMYDSLYGRAPDMGGINHWLSLSEAGVSMGDIADGFIGSAESQALYGAMTNAQFVAALYHGALHRDAKPGEVEGWTRLLDEGRLDRGDVLLGFADSAEKIALVGLISTTIDGNGGS